MSGARQRTGQDANRGRPEELARQPFWISATPLLAATRNGRARKVSVTSWTRAAQDAEFLRGV
jgi:hypothetical protein